MFGSPRKNGYTKALLDELLKNITGYDISIIDAYNENIKPCIACGVCEKDDICIYNDFDEIDELLRTADLLIIATPVYNLSVPSPLKAIFDRTQRYFSARFCREVKRPIAKHKRAILLLTSGRDCEFAKEVVEKQIKMMFTIINASLDYTVFLKNTDKMETTQLPYEEILNIAKELV